MPNFEQGQLEYIDSPPLKTPTHEHKKAQIYNNLMSRTQSLYHVRDVSSHTIALDENGIPNTISIDRGSASSKLNNED